MKLKFFIPKWQKGKGFVRNKIDKSTILVNGLLLTCVILSISSGFVDIVCYSGLSKSFFHLGTVPIAAAVLYTFISVGLTSGKFWCAMKIGMLKELKNRLLVKGKKWGKNISRALLPWQAVHKVLIGISLLTALSMSVNSIGSGIRVMQQNIDNMTADANILIELNSSVTSGVKGKRDAAKETITGALSAKEDAKQEVERYYKELVKYQEQFFETPENDEEVPEGKPTRSEIIQKIVKNIPGATSRNAVYFTKADLQESIQKKATKNDAIDSTKIYEDAVDYDKLQIEETIRAIEDKDYKLPDGTEIVFTDSEGKPINVQLAISRLQRGISAWQSDTGDVGESSKMFTLIATYIKADQTAGGMGASEWMLLVFIFITGIVQEFLIAICTPAATIDRKTLSSVSRYCEWENNSEKEKFLIEVYQDYVGDGVINQEDFEAKCKKCVELMDRTTDDIVSKYSKKKADTTLKLKDEIKKLKEELSAEKNREPKIVEKIVEVEKPVEVIKEVPVEKIVEVPVEVPPKKRTIVKNELSKAVDEKAAEIDNLLEDID